MNQKFIICLIFIQLLTFSLLAQDYLISKTKTITNETTFGDLRNACIIGGTLMNYYYDLPENRDE